MATTVKINSDELIKRLDEKQRELSIDTRSNLVTVLIRVGLDFMDKNTYEEFLKIASKKG